MWDLFKGHWKPRDDWFFSQIREYVCKEREDEYWDNDEDTSGGGDGGLVSHRGTLLDFFQLSKSNNQSVPSQAKGVHRKFGDDDLGLAGPSSGLRPCESTQLVSGASTSRDRAGEEVRGNAERSGTSGRSRLVSSSDSIDEDDRGADGSLPAESGRCAETNHGEASGRSGSQTWSVSPELEYEHGDNAGADDDQSCSNFSKGRESESFGQEESEGQREASQLGVGALSGCSVHECLFGSQEQAEFSEEDQAGSPGTSERPKESVYQPAGRRSPRCLTRSNITEPGVMYGVQDIPTLLLKIYHGGVLPEEDDNSEDWLITELRKSRESLRTRELVRNMGCAHIIQDMRVQNRQRQQSRSVAGMDGGEYALARQTLIRDPYIEQVDLTALHPCLFMWANRIEILRDQVHRNAEPAFKVLCVWLKGTASVGKTRFVWWFSKYILDQRVYALPYSKEYKWWDGYINEQVVHIEEMDTKNHMHASRVKDFCDVSPIRVEKKGTVTRLLRPKVMFFASNYSPETVFGGDWDNAMRSRFSPQ